MDKMTCKDCPDRHLACHDHCLRYQRWRLDHEAERQYTYDMTHTMSCYRRDWEDRRRETGQKRYFGFCGGDANG